MSSKSREEYKWVDQPCPICETPPTKFLGLRGGASHRQNLGVEAEIWQCRSCGLIFPNPMPVPIGGIRQHYELPPEDYFEHFTTEVKNASALALLNQAQALVGQSGRLVDIGSGRGELLRAAREAGWQVTGIEPSVSFAEHARQYSGAQVLTEPIEKCDLPAGKFDIAVLSGVLEHLLNPDETIRTIAGTLRSGGALYLDVPNEQGLYFRTGNFYHRSRRRRWVVNLSPTWPPFHVFGFSPKSLRKLLAKHSFDVAHLACYSDDSYVPASATLIGKLERRAANVVTSLSKFGGMGSFIDCWAIRR